MATMRDRHRHRRAWISASKSGRRVRINAAPKPAESMLEWLRVIWITPSMDALFTGPAADRRRFLDRLVLVTEPGHGQRVARLRKGDARP